jgi:aminoglycoside 6'-N-acetyltransferase
MRKYEGLGSLTGRKVVLRPITKHDVPEMRRILAEDEVRMWWGVFDDERITREILGDSDLASYAILVGDRTVGSIHWHEENEPDYRRAGIDIFVESAFHGTGVAADALTTVARYLFEQRGHHAIDIDPRADNTRAIRAYEKIGFKPVGVRRRYERGDDGTWHDNLLMDLLPEEMVLPDLGE